MPRAVLTGSAQSLAHVPSLVRYGSKPERELAAEGEDLLREILGATRAFENARDYLPNQVYIGNEDPDALWDVERPWWEHSPPGERRGPFGEIMPEEEFYGLLSACDRFGLVRLERAFAEKVRSQLESHPLVDADDLEAIDATEADEIHRLVGDGEAIPLHVNGDEVVGAIRHGYENDVSQRAGVLLENLSAKATAVLATRQLLAADSVPGPETVAYVFTCGEEAIGDRYQRGAGNLGKAVAELTGCDEATGGDLKAFCCAPAHAVVVAAGLIEAGLFEHVLVVAGGSLAKLGMKFRGHLAKGVPLLEDVLGGFALSVSADDGASPRIRLDAVGRHRVRSGSSNQAILEDLVRDPLDKVGLRITDVDKYATELHNPEVTEPAGSGNVPRTNYRMIASLAVLAGQLDRSELDGFERAHGMPGFSPTQGHVAAAVPFISHARQGLLDERWSRVMFIAKGSLFLGKMTEMSDGMSFVLERQ